MPTRQAPPGPTTVSSSQSPSRERSPASAGRSEMPCEILILPRVSSRPLLAFLPFLRRWRRTGSLPLAPGASILPSFTAR